MVMRESSAPIKLADVLAGFHPYACGGKGQCIHCDRTATPDHAPDDCVLCSWEEVAVSESSKKEALRLQPPAPPPDPRAHIVPVYVGMRTESGAVVMFHTREEGTHGRVLDPRLDLMRHSPTGFEWGYCGSGPAQLALAILADFFARHSEHRELVTEIERNQSEDDLPQSDVCALRTYQKFKARVIAGFTEATWVLSDDDIVNVLKTLS